MELTAAGTPTANLQEGGLMPYADWVIEQLFGACPAESWPDWLDVPITDTPISIGGELATVPLLETTWSAIDSAFDDIEAFEWLVKTGSQLDLAQRLGSIHAVLDVSVTLPCWIERDASGRARWCSPMSTESLADAMDVASIRYLRMAGASEDQLTIGSRFRKMLQARTPLRIGGAATLQAAAQLVDPEPVTRERVRQLEVPLNLDHKLLRRWPVSPPIAQLLATLKQCVGLREAAADTRIAAACGPEIHTTSEAIRLAPYFGVDQPVLGPLGVVQESFATVPLPPGITSDLVRKRCWEISEMTGLVLRDDLIRELQSEFPGTQHKDLNTAIDVSITLPDLPHGYCFVEHHRDMTYFGIAKRMLAWTNEISVDSITDGIARRFRMRRLPPPPPASVMARILAIQDDLDVRNDIVTSRVPLPRDNTTNAAWIASLIEDSPYGVLHRSVVLDAARRLRRKQSSIAVYLQFSEIIQPAGRNCVTLCGNSPDPLLIDLAWEEGRAIRVPNRLQTSYGFDCITMHGVLGTNERDSGLVSVPKRARQLLGDVRYAIMSDRAQHGNARVSSNMLQSFTSVFNALELEPGDPISISIDLQKHVIVVGLQEGSDD